MMKFTFLGTVLLLLLSMTPVHATTPLESVKMHLDEVLAILKDPALTGEAGKQEKIEKIKTLADSFFDFKEISKRSLARNWKRFTPDQQKEFVSLYKLLLQQTYSDKIVSYTDERIIFGKEIPLSKRTQEVQTIIKTKTADIPINYRLIQLGGVWKVYDVIIEGVSLINNYRSQFREILGNNQPEDLLETLRKKVGSK